MDKIHSAGKTTHGESDDRFKKEPSKIAEPPMAAAKEIAHIGEVSTNFLHRLHIGVLGALHTLENIIPPIRLGLVGITSILEALNAVYFSKKSDAHRTAQVVIALISTITVVAGLIVPHAALAMLVTYAAVELFREFSHFFEALKDYWKLKRVSHAIDRRKLKQIRHFLMEKAVDIGFGLLAVAGATMALFSTVVLFGTPLPAIGLGLLIASAAGALLFRGGFYMVSKLKQKLKAPKPRNAIPIKPLPERRVPQKPRAAMTLDDEYAARGTAHESTTDIYTSLDLLKAEANQQQKLVEAGWIKQPLMTHDERRASNEFWRQHRLSPYLPTAEFDLDEDEGEDYSDSLYR